MYPLFLSDFNEHWILETDFGKILKYQISLKSVQTGAELFHADGLTDTRADMTKLIVLLRNFAKDPNL